MSVLILISFVDVVYLFVNTMDHFVRRVLSLGHLNMEHERYSNWGVVYLKLWLEISIYLLRFSRGFVNKLLISQGAIV